jgi:hypothetical protein
LASALPTALLPFSLPAPVGDSAGTPNLNAGITAELPAADSILDQVARRQHLIASLAALDSGPTELVLVCRRSNWCSANARESRSGP